MADYINIVSSSSPISGTAALPPGQYYLAGRSGGTTKLVGQFSFIPGLGLNILVNVLNAQPRYTVYAGPGDNLSDGQLAVYGPDGKYSQAATQLLLGSDGSVVVPNTRKESSGSDRTVPGASGSPRIAVYDPAGKYSQAATRTLLGSAGTNVRTGDRSARGRRS